METKCPTGKREYKDGCEAVVDVSRLLRKFGGHYRPYKCDKCSKWHLTTQMRHKRKL